VTPRITVVAASGYDDRAVSWMTSYRLSLVGFVLPLVNGDVQAAEDVVQETMLRGWQHPGRCKTTSGCVSRWFRPVLSRHRSPMPRSTW
jgi:RNA polymerase sigma-70 factor, ECF subfamily